MSLEFAWAIPDTYIGADDGPSFIVDEVTYDGSNGVVKVEGSDVKADIPVKDIIAVVPLTADDKSFPGGYALTYVGSNDVYTPDMEDTTRGYHYLKVLTLPEELNNLIVPSARDKAVHHVHIIISTLSGTCQAESFYENSVQKFLASVGYRAGSSYTIHTTTSAKSVQELTETDILHSANKGQAQRIILMSGDGGIVDIVNALSLQPHSDCYIPPAMSILPMGTGNALAHSIGITDDRTSGLSSLARGSSKPLPIFRATFSPGARLLLDEATREEELPVVDKVPTVYGAVVCSWGMHAGLVADSDTKEYRKFGIDRFKMAAKEALYPSDGSPPHAYKAKISVLPAGTSSWQAVPREEHMYVLATMVSNLEKTFTVSPASSPLSGSLRLVHFGPTTADEAMRVMGLAYQGGKHVDEPLVNYEDIDGMRIEIEGREDEARWRRICLDGKIIRLEKDGWVEIRKENRTVVDVVSM
ncbi:hypothetical protein EJ05DRAFT_264330 [Pseudovirgaria hyperparasitica]|uniref:DAGKc domain-containing protein n=1 Tax=Pseudovirgaria hyperparasitica TaxID=470096 RepID=A0A6A6WGU9_9PEZI|nr:uncharacterized protein EJ05DRAFT_264330 [Pseudovirgaria hyperparasitica]KAF2761439.1 hypothetical protein EJ05DRAFT_264330 [Pseudovirgaria hyperparasitica]